MKKNQILVFGDVMLDHYVSGIVDRMSPEAPVPVVRVTDEWSTPGGAANVAANVAALGGAAILIGLVGNDLNAAVLTEKCLALGITCHLQPYAARTVTKTRVVSGQQIVRFDHEYPFSWESKALEALSALLDGIAEKVNILLISDYAKGTVSDEVLAMLNAWATSNSIKVVVDPKRTDWSAYGPAALITPNLKELEDAAGRKIANDDATVVTAARQMMQQCAVQQLLVTRSAAGMTLLSDDTVLNIPARAREVYDVSGAGDTVLATLGVMLNNGASLPESALHANIAAGIAVGKRGTATVSSDELKAALANDRKLVERKDSSLLKERLSGKHVVFTNGCFDVLHAGHRQLLRQAAALGDVLVVAINSDSSVRRLKGPSRPVNSEKVRAMVLSSLPEVSHVLIFDEDTPYQLISELRPQVLVKGGEYAKSDIVGADLVHEVHTVNMVDGISTTRILEG
jgi:D-beta-D-heptose 7-phosphate kinase / D-beta-D-heptose 1-phosphate adenosyltransferase